MIILSIAIWEKFGGYPHEFKFLIYHQPSLEGYDFEITLFSVILTAFTLILIVMEIYNLFSMGLLGYLCVLESWLSVAVIILVAVSMLGPFPKGNDDLRKHLVRLKSFSLYLLKFLCILSRLLSPFSLPSRSSTFSWSDYSPVPRWQHTLRW